MDQDETREDLAKRINSLRIRSFQERPIEEGKQRRKPQTQEESSEEQP